MSEPQVLASIGLISDTHFQELLFVVPDHLARVWGAVDLVLHAGQDLIDAVRDSDLVTANDREKLLAVLERR